MAKITNNHPLGKKTDRVIYLLEALLALELNRTNLNRNEIRDRLGIDKAKVNKMLDGIARNTSGNLDGTRLKDRPKKAKIKNKKKK